MNRRHWPKIALALVVVAAAIWLVASGAYRDIEPDRLRTELLALGVWGPVAFLLVFALLQPLGLSGHLLILGGALVWPAPFAFALGLVGATIGQSTGFLFFRYIAHDWAQRRMPERLARYQQALASTPLRTVLILRLLTFTWPPAAALLGVSGIRFGPMLAMTLVGLAPGVALDVWVQGRSILIFSNSGA